MSIKKIKNYDELARNDLRKEALSIVESGLQAIDTKRAIERFVKITDGEISVIGQKFNLDKKGRIFVIGVGKCSLDSAEVLEKLYGDYIYKGMVIDIRCNTELKKIKSCEGDHPFPSQRNVDLTSEMIEMLKEVTKDDLVLAIISGGGSTLLCNPVNFTCVDESNIIQCLFRGGANIQEINMIRKHLSLARGGNLAKACYPAQVAVLIFSDVIENDLNSIASGPFIKDNSLVDEARETLKKYDIDKRCSFDATNLMETPKEDKYFEKVHHIILVSNEIGLLAMKKESEKLGYDAYVSASYLIGEASICGERIVKELHNKTNKTVLLYGGETTVRIKGSGKGGRNQELILGAFTKVKENECIVSFASDGRDNTEVAGAICDIISIETAKTKKLLPKKYLDNNDSFPFFAELNDHIITGPTGSNVADFVIALKR
ncbi:MAG: DUF4147 domain-containing protein [Patescibacteria group bacterium]